MKKAKPQSAKAHHTASAGATVLAAPVRRRLPAARPRRGPVSTRAGERSSPQAANLDWAEPLAQTHTAPRSSVTALEQARAPASAESLFAPGSLPPEEVELRLLIDAVYLQSGYDFRNYRRALVRERVGAFLQRERFKSISALQAALLRETPVLQRLLVCLTERETSLFVDPAFYRLLRANIVPWLRTYPFANIWVAGCGNGGEAYSLAMVLQEEGLHERCRIYATDLCEAVVQKAQAGIWPLAELKRAAANYRRAGGQQPFANYYTAENGHGRMAPALARNVVFAGHSLLTDASFNEFHLILCLGILDDFDHILETQVHDLLYGSLVPRGVLALGRHHTLGLTLHQTDYEPMYPAHGLYRKKWPHSHR